MDHLPDSNRPKTSQSKVAMNSQQNSSSRERTGGRPPLWTIHACPTTGGQIEVHIPPTEGIDGLKRLVAKKVKVAKERISLLYKERVLKAGSLLENGLVDGCRITLLPNVESGLVSQKPEHTVMQALENLSETQVNEFLSGKSPLTLAMRLGDHMMFVQLQLSTTAPRSSSSRRTYSSSSTSSSRSSSVSSTPPSSPTSPTSPTSSSSRNVTEKTRVVVPTPVVAVPTPVVAKLSQPPMRKPSPLPPPRFQNPVLPAPSTSSANPGHLLPKPNANITTTQSTVTSNSLSTVPSSKKGSGSRQVDNVTLAEASRNLSKKLKELSKASGSPTKEEKPEPPKKKVKTPSPPKSSSTCANGAIIESMHHHGQGVYSGTFSGTLNPALQDRDGKPKRSISTIIHILNDLLGATPQYRAQMVHNRSSDKRAPEHKIVTTHKISAPLSPCVSPPSSPPSSPPPTMSKSAGDRLRMSQENLATKGKMEQLQMMLEERRQRKRARREGRASPYSVTNSQQWQNKMAAQRHRRREQPMEVDVEASNMGEVAESSAYTELKQETVVA